MTATHEAARSVTRQSLGLLRSALLDLPDQAMDWAPGANANSPAVLVMHALSSLRFFLACGSGEPGSLTAYRESERAAAFRTRGLGRDALLDAIDREAAQADAMLGRGRAADLARQVSFPEDPAVSGTGAEMLFRAVGHLREHVGHCQSVRDAWLAAHPGNR